MIELRYFEPSDFQQLIRWIDSPELLMQWSGSHFSFPLNEKQLENYLEEANKEKSSTLAYKVVTKQNGDVIGHISLDKIDRKNKSARIGRVLIGDKSYRGQGLCPVIISHILEIAFEKLDLHRVSLGVFDFNQSAIDCYEKVGFKKEGLLRESRRIGHDYWNLWEMSILDYEWLETKN